MGIPVITWDASYESSPAGTADPREADDRMREMKSADRERAEREHGWGVAEAIARHGIHKKGSARASYASGDPTTVPDGGTTRALNSTDDDGRLHFDSATRFLKCYTGSAWVALKGYFEDSAGSHVNLKFVDIGDWNMVATATKSVAHGLTYSKIISVTGMIIRNDGDTARYACLLGADAYNPNWAGLYSFDSTNFSLYRWSGTFTTTDFDATSYNRGWITVLYQD